MKLKSETFIYLVTRMEIMLSTGHGNWTDRGCSLKLQDNITGEVQCMCSHLTNFAILVVSYSLATFSQCEFFFFFLLRM